MKRGLRELSISVEGKVLTAMTTDGYRICDIELFPSSPWQTKQSIHCPNMPGPFVPSLKVVASFEQTDEEPEFHSVRFLTSSQIETGYSPPLK